MAVTKLLCFTLSMALANGDDIDLINLFSNVDTRTSSESLQKASYHPVKRYEQENSFAQIFDTSALENFEVKPPKYGYHQHFQRNSDTLPEVVVESASSSYQRSILHDMAAPVTAQPSSRRAVHDLDDVELTSVGGGGGNVPNHRNKFVSARLTTDNYYQDDQVVERERREETDIDVVDTALEDGSTAHDAFNIEMSSLRLRADNSIIRGITTNITQEDIRGRQQLESCEVQLNNGKYDFTCGCNQQLGSDRPIGKLVLNHTSCNQGLWVIWSELESSLRPQSIVFVGVTMTLTNQTVDEESDSTIKNLTFINSNFMDIPMDAFKGLKALEELRFSECILINVLEHAVRNHNKLKTIEIIKSMVGEINQNAFHNLPAIEDFAITHSELKDIKGLGINLNKNNVTGENTPCLGRSSSRYSIHDVVSKYSKHDIVMDRHDIVMGRQIQGADGLNLPEFGTRFLLYKNTIPFIRTNAVNSNAFGFLILGGNNISQIEPQAFNMQLHNPCEISAALFASNNIATLSNQSFVGISNKMNSNNSTFIALNNNIFGDVQVHGFQIEKGIQIFSVDENQFECDCKNLYWFVNNQQSSNSFQTELKMKIISKAKCTTGESITAFRSSCGDLSTSKPKRHHQTHMPVTYNPNPTPQPENSSAVSPSHLTLVNVFVTASIFILIHLHRTILY